MTDPALDALLVASEDRDMGCVFPDGETCREDSPSCPSVWCSDCLRSALVLALREARDRSLSASLGAGLLMTLKAECEKQHARAEQAEAQLAQARAEPVPLWRHAVEECNAAHIALDKLGAPTTKRVRRVRGPEGDQDITIGLAERIRSLLKAPEERDQLERDRATVARETYENLMALKTSHAQELEEARAERDRAVEAMRRSTVAAQTIVRISDQTHAHMTQQAVQQAIEPAARAIDSERDMNAILTEQLEQAEAEVARLKERVLEYKEAEQHVLRQWREQEAEVARLRAENERLKEVRGDAWDALKATGGQP